MTEELLRWLLRALTEADLAANRAVHAKTVKERRRQLMKVGELAQEVQRRIVEALT